MLDLQLSLSSPALLAAFLAVIASYLLFSRSKLSSAPSPSSSSSDAVPLIPLVADLPSAGNFRDDFLLRRRTYGSVHRVNEPNGMVNTYIGDPLSIKDIIEQPDIFEMGPLHSGAAPMWRISPTAGQWFAQVGGQATVRHSSHLFSGSRLAALQKRFVEATRRQFDGLKAGRKEDLFATVSELFFEATMEALFTDRWPKGEYKEYERWDAELTPFCIGMASERAIEARNRFWRLTKEQVDEWLSDCSLQAREQLLELENNYSLPHDDAVAVVLRTAWLGSTQSPLSAGWLLCLLSHRPDAIDKIRTELSQLKQKLAMNTDEIASNPDLLKGENLPTLDNFVNELLRVFSAQSVPRFCHKDTTIRALGPNNTVLHYQVKQGDILQLLYWNVHDASFNPQFWPGGEQGETYEETLQPFDETRFDDADRKPPVFRIKEDNETVKTWTPFGYGVRVCPGRYWAVAEIKAFVLMFLQRFDVREMGKLPRPDAGRWLGVLHPKDGMAATLSARSSNHLVHTQDSHWEVEKGQCNG